ncbi:hypothetical protein D3C71_942240 [compost metagenome]
MHARHQARAAHAQHAGRVIQAGGNPRVAALHGLQGHGTKPHQIGPHNAKRRGRDQRAHAPLRHGRLQPAHGQQQAHHNDGARHGVAHAGQLHHAACDGVRLAAHCKCQRQGDDHGQHGGDAPQAHAVPGPFHETLPRQHRPVGRQRAQHEENRGDKTHHHRHRAHHPGGPAACAAQRQGLCLGRACAPAACGETHALLRAMFQVQQRHHHHQQHGGQLRGGQAVVHRQPGLVDAGGEGLDAEIAGHTKVSQRFHQHQRNACSDCWACQGQRHGADAARQRSAQQPRGLHEVRGTLAQRCARQQVHIRVQRKDEHPHRAAQAAHLGQQAAFQAKGVAQTHLQRAAELQKVGVGIRSDIRRHGQGQQQQPFKRAAAREIKQRHRGCRACAHNGRAQGHQHAQPQGGPHIARQHGGRHLAQDGARLRIALPHGQPRCEHGQHGQRQKPREQDQRDGAKGRKWRAAQGEWLGKVRKRTPAGRLRPGNDQECKCEF